MSEDTTSQKITNTNSTNISSITKSVATARIIKRFALGSESTMMQKWPVNKTMYSAIHKKNLHQTNNIYMSGLVLFPVQSSFYALFQVSSVKTVGFHDSTSLHDPLKGYFLHNFHGFAGRILSTSRPVNSHECEPLFKNVSLLG